MNEEKIPELIMPKRRLALWLGPALLILFLIALFIYTRGCGTGSAALDELPFYLASPDAPALNRAAALGDAREVRRLIAAGALLDGKDFAGETPLQAAVFFDRTEAARALIEAKASLDLTNADGRTALFTAVLRDNIAITKMLMASGASARIRDALGYDPFLFAVRAGSLELVRVLLENGADMASRDNEGNTALHLAAFFGRTEVFAYLLSCGISPLERNTLGMNALALAAEGRRVPIVRSLLRTRLPEEQQTLAADEGTLDPDFILQMDKGIFERDDAGRSALHWAVLGGHPAVIRMLLDAGLDPQLGMHDGKSALDLARDGHNGMLHEILEQR